MAVASPIPQQRISADWGRSVAEAIAAGRLLGPGVARTPVGTTLPAPLPAPPSREAPPSSHFAVWVAKGDAGLVLRVLKGAVRDGSGAALDYEETDFTDGAGGFWEAAAPEGSATVVAEALGTGWTLRIADDDGDQAWRVPVANVDVSDDSRKIDQLHTGDILLPHQEHWGDAKPLTELPADADGSWEARKNPAEGETASAVAESSLIELELDEEGRVSAKRYRTRTFDTHGNLIAISDRTESATPDPGGEEKPDPCGNPLNAGSEATDDDWDNPLSSGGGGGGANDDAHDHPPEWDNPLDSEGDGGYTPTCRNN